MLSLEHLAGLAQELAAQPLPPLRTFSLGGRIFDFNAAPAIMGVVNLSADSWYRESVCLTTEAAIARGRVLCAQGAAIVDIGAESTLAHAARVDSTRQQAQVLPVIREWRVAGLLASLETYDVETARVGLAAGAQVINLTGLADSPEIYRMAADHSAAVIICYVQGKNVRESGDFDAQNIIATMTDYFARQIDAAAQCGLEKILIDPGLGFYYRNLQDSATRVRHQMNTFLQTFRLRALGVPVCHALPHAFETFGEEVRSAEPFFAVLAALGKTNLFRTHEVSKVKAVLDTLRQF
jgi:dihydropteroate synthase